MARLPAERWRAGAWIVGLGVVSHWVLDVVSHRPDMPILPHGPYVGLGLWNSLPATLAVEGTIFSIGLVLYLRATRATDGWGRYGLAGLVAFLLLAYAGALFGPPPSEVRQIAYAGLLGWLLITWAYSVDAHRTTPSAQ